MTMSNNRECKNQEILEIRIELNRSRINLHLHLNVYKLDYDNFVDLHSRSKINDIIFTTWV